MNFLKLKKSWPILVFLLFFIDIFVYLSYINPIILCKNSVMNVVGHPDDDLLFLSPDLISNIDKGKCVRSVFVTAADAGQDKSYWLGREEGIKAAYSFMAKTSNSWVEKNISFKKNRIAVFNLKNDPRISLIFIRLPDGSFQGTGYKNHNYESIGKLAQEKITRISTVDGSAKYTKESLINTLLSLMEYYKPNEIHTQDLFVNENQGDHSDHYAAGYFTYLAEKKYLKPHKTIYYVDYAIESKSANISQADYLIKKNAFLIYANYDQQATNQNYLPWLTRQYKTQTD